MDTIRTGVSGMMAYKTGGAVTAHNIANINTAAFKKSRAGYTETTLRSAKIMKRDISGAVYSPAASAGGGVTVRNVSRINKQGTLSVSRNSTDIALSGRGYFNVALPDGTTAYTRNGAVKMSPDGTLVTADGYAFQPEITIPPNAESILIKSDGTVEALISGQPGNSVLGQLQISGFNNPEGLKSINGNLFAETAASGQAITGTPGTGGFGSVIQGALEDSNVDVAEEQVSLIINQRAFEANVNTIKTADAMLKTTIDIRR